MSQSFALQTKVKARPGAGWLPLAVLLVAPALALSRLPSAVLWPWTCVMLAALSLITFVLYRADKRRSENGAWRIPELTLHLLELAGGWPGAFLAQHIFRHKTAKFSFQLVFWIIVLLHQLVAIDTCRGWPWLNLLARRLGV